MTIPPMSDADLRSIILGRQRLIGSDESRFLKGELSADQIPALKEKWDGVLLDEMARGEWR